MQPCVRLQLIRPEEGPRLCGLGAGARVFDPVSGPVCVRRGGKVSLTSKVGILFEGTKELIPFMNKWVPHAAAAVNMGLWQGPQASYRLSHQNFHKFKSSRLRECSGNWKPFGLALHVAVTYSHVCSTFLANFCKLLRSIV